MRKREPPVLRKLESRAEWVEREPVPCCHGYFPDLPFRQSTVSHKPSIDPDFVGDQRRRRQGETFMQRMERLRTSAENDMDAELSSSTNVMTDVEDDTLLKGAS